MQKIDVFLSENGVLADTQHGFRKGKCLEVAVQEFIEKIQKK